jgi:hypothetical protein
MKDILEKVMSGEYVAYSDVDGVVKLIKSKDTKNISLLSKELEKQVEEGNIEIIEETDSIRIIKKQNK